MWAAAACARRRNCGLPGSARNCRAASAVRLFAQVDSKDHLSRVLDEVLYHPLVAVVGQQSPVDLRLAVPLEMESVWLGA